jgi:starch-binding outer membrane protein, SusD/RagB family
MRNKTLLLLIAAALTACSGILDVPPSSSVPSNVAISDAAGARSALNGAYAGLQLGSYYAETFVDFVELLSDNARHTGTFDDYKDADQYQMRAENISVGLMWDDIYDAINRTNEIIQKVPNVTGLTDTEKNEILGEAYFLRALHYHNVVKLWGETPLRLEPAKTPDEASTITRSSVAATYTQILADLAQAEQLITAGRSQTRQASLGAAYALEARVKLYQKDWAGAEAAAANAEALGYSLAPNFSDLFDATGNNTPEDIFRITFTPTQKNFLAVYYLPKGLAGRFEVGPTITPTGIVAAFDPASGGDISLYNPTDKRGIWSIARSGTRAYIAKFRNPGGDEDIHVIRLGEVILIRAEALAMLGRLPEAVAEYNRLRVRAGVAADPTTGLTQAGVLAAIARERRLELAFEGDRWPDLVRTGTATTLGVPATQQLLPIPQSEIDVARQLTQNPGY